MIKGTVGMVGLAAAATSTAACSSEEGTGLRRAGTTGTAGAARGGTTAGTTGGNASDPLFAELDEKIQSSMQKYAIPGVSVGVLHNGREYLRGYGITSVDVPQPVDERTLFRIGSTTKTFTGTAVMRLVEANKLDLDATVRTYLPEFVAADPAVSAQVTLRQLLNHSAGWLGDYLQDFGRGDEALERYVANMANVPQQTPVGSTFFYNNPAISLAGRVIEKVHGTTYEKAVQDLVLDPLHLDHTRFFTDEVVGNSIAGSHKLVAAPNDSPSAALSYKAVIDPSFWYLPRSLSPTGGLISSARDQLSFLRFHLGDGTGPDGKPVLTRASLEAMRSRPGPGGTLLVELDGMGVTFMLRPSAEGVRIVQHGGDWLGQHSGFLFVPERNFAFTVLTNSDGGSQLTNDLFYDDWALSRFAGIHNLPAEPQRVAPDRLAAYEGRYTSTEIEFDGQVSTSTVELTAEGGGLRLRALNPDLTPIDPPPGTGVLTFYRDDFVLTTKSDGSPAGPRADFVRGPTGAVEGFRMGGRLRRKVS